MTIKYGSPTFILRNECEQDLLGVLREMAKRGFEGVELFGMFGYDPNAIRRTCDEVGLTIICDHIRYEEFVEDAEQVIDDRLILGAKYITIDEFPSEKLPGGSQFGQALEELERIGELCQQNGMQLLYHNQGFDTIQQAHGKPILEVLLDSIAPELLKFQIDLGWLEIGGAKAQYFLDKYGDRCPIIHLKDYYSEGPVLLSRASSLGTKRGGAKYNNFEFRPTGYGIMDFAALMPSILACEAEWLIADHDLSYDGRDSLDELLVSLEYIKKLVSFYK